MGDEGEFGKALNKETLDTRHSQEDSFVYCGLELIFTEMFMNDSNWSELILLQIYGLAQVLAKGLQSQGHRLTGGPGFWSAFRREGLVWRPGAMGVDPWDPEVIF